MKLIQKEKHSLSELRNWLLPMLLNGLVTIKEAEKTIEQAQENISMAAEPNEDYKVQ